MHLKADRVALILRSRREELDMTQADLAKRLGWVKSHSMFVSNIENCKVQIPTRKVKKVVDALDLDIEDIIEAMVDDYRACLIDELLDKSDKHKTYKKVVLERKRLKAKDQLKQLEEQINELGA